MSLRLHLVEYIEQHQDSNRAILVSVSVQLLDDLDVEEFRLLAQSASAEILEHITAQRIKPDPKLFIGSGKAEEIAELAETDRLLKELENANIEIEIDLKDKLSPQLESLKKVYKIISESKEFIVYMDKEAKNILKKHGVKL